MHGTTDSLGTLLRTFTAHDIEGALRKLGPPDQCYVFAESDALDGK